MTHSLNIYKNLFLVLISTLITVNSFSQQKPTRGYYNDKDMRDLLNEFIDKRMPQLENQIFAKDPKIDEYKKSNKFYSKEKEHPVDRYMFADECKIIHLEKVNDSTIFYGQPVKLLEINKNKAVIELPKTLYKKVKKIQAISVNNNYIDYFSKYDVPVFHPAYVKYFKEYSKKIIALSKSYNVYKEDELKDILNQYNKEGKNIPLKHEDEHIKVFIRFHGSVKEIILFVKE